MERKRVAFVVVRYGLDVNGGAEYHCRMLAERLVKDYDVEVLTTCVKDYINGGNEVASKMEQINGVLVRRFEALPIDDIPEEFFGNKAKPVRRLRMFLYKIHCLRLISYFMPVWRYLVKEEEETIKRSVFYSRQLNEFVKENKHMYDVFIAVTMDYAPFYYTALYAGEKTIAIPTMHYAKTFFRAMLTKAFSNFAYVGFNTNAEQKLAENVFGRALGPHGIISVGIEDTIPADWEKTKMRYGLPDKYLLYVGRLDRGKVNNIVSYFSNYKKKYNESPLKFVMVGSSFEKLEVIPDVIYTGFVTDEEKTVIIQHAVVVVNPSLYESLSLILLEVLNLGRPMLVNGHCAVLKEHCLKSHGAVDYYMNEKQFISKLHKIESSLEVRERMVEGGKRYVEENYNWALILSRLKQAVETVAIQNKNMG